MFNDVIYNKYSVTQVCTLKNPHFSMAMSAEHKSKEEMPCLAIQNLNFFLNILEHFLFKCDVRPIFTKHGTSSLQPFTGNGDVSE